MNNLCTEATDFIQQTSGTSKWKIRGAHMTSSRGYYLLSEEKSETHLSGVFVLVRGDSEGSAVESARKFETGAGSDVSVEPDCKQL